MPAVKWIQVNDVHASDRAPANRLDTYTQDIFTKLDEITRLVDQNNVAFVVFCGDLFHTPQASRVTHQLVGQWLDIVTSFDCDVFIVPGNHDLAAGRIESLPKQPLGILGRAPNVHIFTDPKKTLRGVLAIKGIPWSYRMDANSMRDAVNPEKPIDLIITHAPITRQPNPFYPTIQPEQLAGLAPVIAFGHMHPPEAPYKVGSTTFVNPGALSRGALDETDLHRTPQIAFHMQSTDPFKHSVEYIKLKTAKPSSEVFKVEAAKVNRENSEAVETFLQSLDATTIDAVTIESLCARIDTMTDDREVAEEAKLVLHSL